MSAAVIPVSAIVMTKNEGVNIAKCLRSLAGFDEIFVVDSDSTDNTRDIARAMGATVVPFRWNGAYPKKKQWCLDNLPFRNDWILNIDADEEITPNLRAEIASIFEDGPAHSGYFVSYDYVFLGSLLQHGQKIHKLALFDRHKGRFAAYDDLEATNSGEVELHFQPEVRGSVGKLRNSMLHADHDNLFDFFERHNRYSDWEAHVRSKGAFIRPSDTQWGARGRLKAAFNRFPYKAPIYFVYDYIVRLGFLGGRPAFHYALAKAFYYWQIELKMQELRRTGAIDAGSASESSAR